MNLGRVAVVPQGNYNPTLPYKKLDMVSFDGGSFIAFEDINIGESPISHPIKWQQTSEKGDDGVGIINTNDNGNGTFTINYTDGSSFTSGDMTGPKGEPFVYEDFTPSQLLALTGPEGKSAYQVWLDAGNTGSVQDYLDSLKGADGGIPEAPNDGKMYGRMNGAWVEINVIPDPSTPQFYVRPLGGSYGLEDGSSYENAWNGFSNIDWGLLENNELNICGTHTQTFYVLSNNVTINFNDSNESGYIDADGKSTGMSINSLNNITLNSPKINNATVQNIIFTDSEGVVNDADCNNSGNQSFQHIGDCIVIYNNVKSHGNGDEGISLHDNSTVILNGIIDLQDNFQAAINYVGTSKVTINGTVIFADNLEADILLSGQNLVKEDMILTINNQGKLDNFGFIKADAYSTITLNGGTYDKIELNKNDFIASDAIIDELSGNLTNTNTKITNTVIKNLPIAGVETNQYEFINSRVNLSGNGIFRAQFKATNSLFDCTASSAHPLEWRGGSVDINHCVFINPNENKNTLFFKTGAEIININNIIIDGKGIGRGIYSQVDGIVNNAIIVNTTTNGINAADCDIIANNCNFYGNTVDTVGGVTLNNSVSGDPLFTNPSVLDYSLQVGSPCIGAGIATTDDEGIDTVDWNDEPIEMTTKTQTVPFDVGAYVS